MSGSGLQKVYECTEVICKYDTWWFHFNKKYLTMNNSDLYSYVFEVFYKLNKKPYHVTEKQVRSLNFWETGQSECVNTSDVIDKCTKAAFKLKKKSFIPRVSFWKIYTFHQKKKSIFWKTLNPPFLFTDFERLWGCCPADSSADPPLPQLGCKSVGSICFLNPSFILFATLVL